MSRYLVDAMCGDLLAYLRMCGHDAAYAPDRDLEADDELLAVAGAEDRTVVTRDRQLAARARDSSAALGGAVLLESQDTEAQLRTLLEAGVDLVLSDAPERCGRCNGGLERLPEDASTGPEAPAPDEEPVWRCADCGQHFWRGSHWDRVAATLARVRGESRDGD